VLARVRSWFDGSGWFVAGAVVLLAFALLMILVELQSADLVLWTGAHVTGTERHGLVGYQWQGQSYALAVQGFGSAEHVPVYLDPGDPSHAMVDSTFDRVGISVLVLGPVAGAAALLVAGGTRKRRWARRQFRLAREFRLLARRAGYLTPHVWSSAAARAVDLMIRSATGPGSSAMGT
jgi:hypothetical protein